MDEKKFGVIDALQQTAVKIRDWTNAKLSNKVDKVSGKGLSTNDYTTADKNKLSAIEAGANKTVVDSNINASSTNPVQNKVIYSAIQTVSDRVGNTNVSDQISDAIKEASADDFGVYVQETEPTDAVDGDIWIDTLNDPTFFEQYSANNPPPYPVTSVNGKTGAVTIKELPSVTTSENGKVLMVVNGAWSVVDLKMSIDSSGVLYV